MMQEMTSTSNCLKSSDDPEVYLAWADMEWNFTGNIQEYSYSAQKMCKESDGITTTFLPGTFFELTWTHILLDNIKSRFLLGHV